MSDEQVFDVAIIGGGPGGYPAAIKAAQAGKRVALIESKDLGGTCLNWGCVPTKTLLANAEMLNRVRMADEFGIDVGNVSFDYGKMAKRKDEVVLKVRKGLESLIAANQITLFRGFGKFVSPTEIKITGQDNAIITAKHTIIATGSECREVPAFPSDGKQILNSYSALQLTTLPKSMVIIGGGVIGCEFASLFHELGVEITILEALPRIIATEAPAISSTLTKSFEKRGMKIHCEVFVEGIEKKKGSCVVKLAGGETHEAEQVLVAVGRTLNTTDIGLDKAGVVVDDKGVIAVNEKMETNVPGIYAIGDITGKWMLAHVATHQGIVAARNAIGEESVMHYNAIPSVIFTTPEIGSVGMTLEQAIEDGHPATLGQFPFEVLGKAQASQHTEGFAQIVLDKHTKQVLGAQVVGYEAATLVAEMGVVIANELTTDSITETIHAHPTIAEAWLEAAMISNDTPLHLPPKKKRKKEATK